MSQANFNNPRQHKDITQRRSKRNSTRTSVSQARFNSQEQQKHFRIKKTEKKEYKVKINSGMILVKGLRWN